MISTALVVDIGHLSNTKTGRLRLDYTDIQVINLSATVQCREDGIL